MQKIHHIPLILPQKSDIFKAFEYCSYDDLKVVIVGQDPYYQRGVATGIAFANSNDTPEDKISASLKVLKDSVIDYNIPHGNIIFDNSLITWEKQGILLLNSSLTVVENMPNSHSIYWLPFISKLLNNISVNNPGIIYVLLGTEAKLLARSLAPGSIILTDYHPAYYARNNIPMPRTVFNEVDRLIKLKYNETIQWFQEIN